MKLDPPHQKLLVGLLLCLLTGLAWWPVARCGFVTLDDAAYVTGNPQVQSGLTPGENGVGTIAHRYVENASVNAAEELVNMIMTQRAYEANSKAIKASDEMLEVSNGLRR